MSAARLPSLPGFETIDHPGARVLCRPEAAPWVRYVLEGGQGLHAAAARERNAWPLEGRATVYVIPAKERTAPSGPSESNSAQGRWVVRHYVRGGRLVPFLLGDRYLRMGRIRPFHEARASDDARARGIPTPRVVAAAMYPAGWFYRADLVTEYIPESTDLVEALFDTRRKGAGGALERQDALQAAGELIRQMADAGVFHRDLHAGNILLQWVGSAPRPYLVDLDRCEVRPPGRRAAAAGMVGRLRRSVRKWEGWSGLKITEKEWAVLRSAVDA